MWWWSSSPARMFRDKWLLQLNKQQLWGEPRCATPSDKGTRVRGRGNGSACAEKNKQVCWWLLILIFISSRASPLFHVFCSYRGKSPQIFALNDQIWSNSRHWWSKERVDEVVAGANRGIKARAKAQNWERRVLYLVKHQSSRHCRVRWELCLHRISHNDINLLMTYFDLSLSFSLAAPTPERWEKKKTRKT